ncbi:MAG: universal stress protein [Dehalococcoidales bacterium]
MYQKIMVPLDGSELAECVLPHVETLVKGGGVQEVIFVRVSPPFELIPVRGDPWFNDEQIAQIDARTKKVAEDYLDELVSRIDYDKVNVKAEVLTGKIADNLADYAVKNEVDIIVIATHGRSGMSRWVMGGVSDRIIRSSCVPVLTVRSPGCAPRI